LRLVTTIQTAGTSMPAIEEREHSHAKTGDLGVFLSFLPGSILTLVHYGVETLIRSIITKSANIVCTQWEEPWKGDILWNKKWYRMGEQRRGKNSEYFTFWTASPDVNGTEGRNQR
jgi:hypothetical protein